MSPEDFTQIIKKEILTSLSNNYKDLIEKGSLKDYWPNMFNFCRSLNDKQKEDFLKIIEQVMIDVISNFFGILDGNCLLKSYDDNFLLTYGDNQEPLNGMLQDYFLSDIQTESKNINHE